MEKQKRSIQARAGQGVVSAGPSLEHGGGGEGPAGRFSLRISGWPDERKEARDGRGDWERYQLMEGCGSWGTSLEG